MAKKRHGLSDDKAKAKKPKLSPSGGKVVTTPLLSPSGGKVVTTPLAESVSSFVDDIVKKIGKSNY